MKIGVIGRGVVGSATGKAFEPHVDEVRYYDKDESRSTHALEDIVECDLTFICVPTPQKSNSLECDLTVVYSVASLFNHNYAKLRESNLVLRSTVPVGTTRMLREKYGLTNLVHSPEFLTARTAEEDARNPTRLVIGDPTNVVSLGLIGGTMCSFHLYHLYQKIWTNVKIHIMTSDESEFVKLMQNSFSAIKIAAFNEFRSFSDAKELDWERCMAALLAGGWINPMHTQVPGPDGLKGFGGTCLPKDLANLIDQYVNAGLKGRVMFSAYERNLLIDRPQTQGG